MQGEKLYNLQRTIRFIDEIRKKKFLVHVEKMMLSQRRKLVVHSFENKKRTVKISFTS